MDKKRILKLKENGLKNDAIYEIAAGEFGLFGAAFFGHACTKSERQKLNRTWKRIVITNLKN